MNNLHEEVITSLKRYLEVLKGAIEYYRSVDTLSGDGGYQYSVAEHDHVTSLINQLQNIADDDIGL